jgi:hypothetical protein
MIMLVRPKESGTGIRYPDDVAALRKILNDAGYDASDHDIQLAWELYSIDEYFASWLAPHVGDPQSAPWIIKALKTYLVPQ